MPETSETINESAIALESAVIAPTQDSLDVVNAVPEDEVEEEADNESTVNAKDVAAAVAAVGAAVALSSNDIDKKAKRAERFGIPLKEDVKKVLRAERFGIAPAATSSREPSSVTGNEKKQKEKKSKKNPAEIAAAAKIQHTVAMDPATLAKMQQRAERFGIASIVAVVEEPPVRLYANCVIY